MRTDNCPHCNTSLIGDPIPEKYLQHKEDHDEQVQRYGRCYCRPYGDSTHFRREMGNEIPWIYDGILFWSCPDCGLAWPRWTDGGHLTTVAADYVERYNEAQAVAA